MTTPRLFGKGQILTITESEIPQLIYVVVGVDPAVTCKEGSDDTGIVVAGKGTNGHGYVLGDYTLHDTPKKWAEAAITAYNSTKLSNRRRGQQRRGPGRDEYQNG